MYIGKLALVSQIIKRLAGRLPEGKPLQFVQLLYEWIRGST